jgi:hypothetical protein
MMKSVNITDPIATSIAPTIRTIGAAGAKTVALCRITRERLPRFAALDNDVWQRAAESLPFIAKGDLPGIASGAA